MPDLTYHAARWCLTNELASTTAKGSRGEVYSVTFHKGQYHCSCKGFTYTGDCKHVKAFSPCQFGHMAAAGSPESDDVWVGPASLCPECGGPTSVMSFAA